MTKRRVARNKDNKMVMWCMLMERQIHYQAVLSAMRVASVAAREGYGMIHLPYGRTDDARNTAVLTFLKFAKHAEDTLVMLDCDHEYEPDVVTRLVKWNVGVVGALAFRRSPPYDPLLHFAGENGHLHTAEEWPPDISLTPCAIVSTSAIAIQAWVFKKLEQSGSHWPWFRYDYDEKGRTQPSEDIYFGRRCMEAGISHHCDFSLIIPHLTTSQVNRETFEIYKSKNDKEPSVQKSTGDLEPSPARLGGLNAEIHR